MIRLALHGGAGDLATDTTQPEHRAALRSIAESGLRLLREGGSALDTVEHVVGLLEDCPLFNAGIGAVLNRDGVAELDAAIMNGADRACGAVAGVMRARSPVRLARAVMQRSPHVLFVGTGAEALNRELGLDEVDPDFFITETRRRQLDIARRTGVIVLDHHAAFEAPPSSASGGYGTVGAVARDGRGHLAAATSTGGLTNKHPGRIGDTPLVGAGTWADDRSAAISCTGTGESFIKACFGHEVHARMLYSNWDLARACGHALDEVRRYGGLGGCIAIDHEGRIALPFNSQAMYRAWVEADGSVRAGIGPDEA